MPMISSEASLQTRLRVWFSGVPFMTRTVLVACVSLYLFSAFTGLLDFSAVCLAPTPVFHGQVYRILTAALAHGGLLHLALNMMAFVPLGASLERHYGSLQYLWIMVLLLVLGDGLYLLAASASFLSPAGLPVMLRFYNQCAVGLSGVIFGLVLIDNHHAGSPTRSIFGLFSVPTAYFPWVLLVVWQMIVPHASLLGHLTGLLVGQAFVMGKLRWALPASPTYTALERRVPLCLNSPSFIAHTSGSAGDSLLPTRSPGGGGGAPHSGWLTGPWMAFPPSGARLHMSGMSLSSLFGGSQQEIQADQAQQGTAQQAQQGVRLGGSQAPADAKAAAAAAAEARLAGKPGGRGSGASGEAGSSMA